MIIYSMLWVYFTIKIFISKFSAVFIFLFAIKNHTLEINSAGFLPVSHNPLDTQSHLI